jgi:exonuclease SbcC
MLKKLQLINFQGHKKSTIVFSPRITGIIGLSLAGKTSIVRGIKFVKDNRPLKFRFHSHFAPKGSATEVILDFDDSTITSKKTTKTHIYQIDDQQPLRKFGKGVPIEVTEILNIDDINIQYEWDDPFLIRGSHPEIARAISRAVNTDVIEKAISKIKKEKNILTHERRFTKADVEEKSTRLESLAALDDIEPLIKRAKKIGKAIDKLGEEFDELEKMKIDIEKTQNKINKTKNMLKAKPLLNQAEDIDAEIENLKTEKSDLEQIGTITSWINVAEKTHGKFVSQYIKALRNLGKCPTCFGPLNEKTIRRIKSEIRI